MTASSANLPHNGMLTRREVLAGAGALAGVAALAGCAGGGDEDASHGALTIASWPFYIDAETIPAFERETAIRVTYLEEITSSGRWFADHEEQLAGGVETGRDLVVLSDWMASRMLRLGYVELLDRERIPNAADLIEPLASPAFDPDRAYTMPWAAGIVGLAYDVDATGRELSSVNDVFDPRFGGRVSLLAEPRDTLGLVLLGMDLDPATATPDEAAAAASTVRDALDAGLVQRFTRTEHVRALVSGDLAVAFARSGEIAAVQGQHRNIRFVVPEEGGMLFSDEMVVPVPTPADRKANAEAFIDFVYDPPVSERIFASVRYIAPVVGAVDAATDPLMSPTAETWSRLVVFNDLDVAESVQLDELFRALVER